MREGLNEPVSVLSGYSQKDKKFKPLILTWKGIDYRLGKVDFYHRVRRGSVDMHYFSLSDKDQSTYFKLLFDGKTLIWTLQEFMMAGSDTVEYAR